MVGKARFTSVGMGTQDRLLWVVHQNRSLVCKAVLVYARSRLTSLRAPALEGLAGFSGRCLRECVLEGNTVPDLHRTSRLWARSSLPLCPDVVGVVTLIKGTRPHAIWLYVPLVQDFTLIILLLILMI